MPDAIPETATLTPNFLSANSLSANFLSAGADLTINGVYFDGQSSREYSAQLRLLGAVGAEGGVGSDTVLLLFWPAPPHKNRARVRSSSPEVTSHTATPASFNFTDLPADTTLQQQHWPLAQLQIQPPLGRVRRVLKFPDGGRFETEDDTAVSRLERQTRQNRGLGQVRRLETSWRLTLGALLGLGVFVWGFLVYGLPLLARTAAQATPRTVLASFDRETLKVLQKGDLIGPSRLSAARQAQLQREFGEVRGWAGGGYPYHLLLRNGKEMGANAFALPGGTIVMTDQLVALAKTDRELMGVLAHETGHVTHRHALSSVYQGLGLSLLSAAVTGDLVSAATFAAAVPTALLKTGYSRQAETQADEVAGQFMLAHDHTTRPLQNILARLELDDKNAAPGDIKASQRGEDLLQTHPGTRARIDHLRQMEAAAKGQ